MGRDTARLHRYGHDTYTIGVSSVWTCFESQEQDVEQRR